MSGQILKCCYCQRDTDKIKNAMSGGLTKPSRRTLQEILFLDSQNRLTCARCISEHDLGMKLDGNPVYAVNPQAKKTMVNREAIAKANKEPVELDLDVKPTFFK